MTLLAEKVTESNGSLLLGMTDGLTASTLGSAPGPTLDNECVRTLISYNSECISYCCKM